MANSNGHGGRRPGAGRPPGSRNKASSEEKRSLAELASAHVPIAMSALVDIMRSDESEIRRVRAALAILDRAYGRPRVAEFELAQDSWQKKLDRIIHGVVHGLPYEP